MFLLNADLESLDDNMSTKPTIIINEKSKQISLRMSHVTKETNCNFDLIMNFCKNFITRIRCDFVIKPLVFAFEVYDYCLKKFTTESCKIFLSDIHSMQSLIFRISFLNQSVKECQISYLLPSPICIGKTDIDSFDKFTINNNVFTFNIAINNITLHPNLKNNENYGITLEIEQIQKTIKFEFIDQQNVDFNKKKYYPSKYPCFIYNQNNVKWTPVKNIQNDIMNCDNTNIPCIIVTPFKYLFLNQEKFVHIDYHPKNSYCVSATNIHRYFT